MTGSGFQSGSTVCPSDQASLLVAVVKKIRAEIPAFSTGVTCIISDTPFPSVEVNDYVFCTVCPESDTFAPDDPVGGGSQGIIEVSSFRVSVFSRVERDQLEREDQAYLAEDAGLLPLKKAVLKCLAGQQIFADYPINQQPMLIEWCRPVSAHHPPHGQHKDEFSSFGITFEAPFYWDLS